MRRTLPLLLLLHFYVAYAAIPSGYYNAAEGKTGAALKTQLSSIISSGYVDKGYDGLYNIYKTSDLLPNGKIWDMYSLKSDGTANYYFSSGSSECGSYNSEGDCYNREHTFCDSWLGAASPQRSDAHHVIPTDGYVNNRRSSFPHGKVGSASWTSSNGSKLGNGDASIGYNGTVFEPTDQFKGDFARMYFYVATRYESKIAGWVNNGSAGEILAGNTYPAYKEWFYKLMVQWSNQDPVSQKEIDRNDAIYAAQKNRNPFIDYPELVNYIWGNKVGQNWSLNASTDPVLFSPSNSTLVNFGNVFYNHTDTASVYIKGQNLTGNLSLSVIGTNLSMFKLPVTSISLEQAQAGYRLVIEYTASVIGVASAQLNISGGGITPVQVDLKATATDDFMALSATNITLTGFTANWTSSAGATGYSLNVYQLTGNVGPTQTLLENYFDSGFPSGWASIGYYDTSTNSNLRMGSGSQNCLITTSTLDLSKPTVVTVKSKQYGSDTGAKLWLIAGTNDTITSFVNSADYQTFTYNIPAKQSSTTLGFYAVKGKRVFLDYVKLTTVGTTQTVVNVLDYPKSVGDVLTYNVESLESNTNYYYTVTPEGNSTGVSDVISVRTDLTNGNENVLDKKIIWYKNQSAIVVKNIPSDYQVSIFTTTGQKLVSYISDYGELKFTPQSKGVYFLKAQSGDHTYTVKIVF